MSAASAMPGRRPPSRGGHSIGELVFWVLAAALAGALVMLLFLPDRQAAHATPPPVRTPRLAHGDGHPTPGPATTITAPPEESDEEGPADREQADEEPTRRDLEAGMAAVQSRVEACRSVENYSGMLSVRVVITRSGAVQSVSVLPPDNDTATAKCVQHAVAGATFAHFRGQLHPTVELVYPFYFPPS